MYQLKPIISKSYNFCDEKIVQKWLFDRKAPHWTTEHDGTKGFEPDAHFVNGLWAQQRSTFQITGPDLIGQLRNIFPVW